MTNEEILKELKEIKQELKLQNIFYKEKIKEKVKKLLTTPKRKEMYSLLDGKHSLTDISNGVKVTHENIRQFVKDLESENLIILDHKKGKEGYFKKLI